MNVPTDLRVGDVLFYEPSSIIGVAIAIKTFTWLSHVEGYCGQERVIAARELGVNIYHERIDKYLVAVRRPLVERFDLANAWRRIMPLMGPYQALGFVEFFSPFRHHWKATRICSSVITEWLRGGGVEPFNPEVDSADVSPAQLWQTAALNTVWER